jgi:hypothetical protein
MAGVPGRATQVPKRSDQRRRRNATNAVEKVAMEGTVTVPDLGLIDAHPLAIDMYESLKQSGQARFFEPTDWQRARLMCEMVSRLLSADRMSAVLYSAIQQDMNELLFTEAERRRVRMEVERGGVDTSEQDARAALMSEYRQAAA